VGSNLDLRTLELLTKIALPLPVNPVKWVGELLSRGVIKPVGGGAAKLLAGAKQTSGPFAGTRLRHLTKATNPKGWTPISQEQAAKLLSNPKDAHLVQYMNFGGASVPMKRKVTVGGVAGQAHKHPVIASLLGYLGYKGLTRPPSAQGYAPQMRPAQDSLDQYFRPMPPTQGTF